MRVRGWLLCLLLLVGLSAVPAVAQGELPATPVRAVRLQGIPSVVFPRLGQLYGVRLRVEPGLPPRSLQLRLDDVDFATALRLATELSGTFWALDPDGTVVIAPDTPEMRVRYERLEERTFALPGRTTEELTEAMRVLRELLEMRRIRPDPRSNTLSVRDTPRRLDLAQQLLAQLYYDPGEVWLEVVLLEVDREKAQRLGVLPPDQVIAVHLGAGALALSGAASLDQLLDNLRFLFEQGLLPRAITDAILRSLLAGGALDPNALTLPPFILVGGGGTTYATLLPGATLNLFHLARVTRSSRRLHLRARDGEEATLFVGERFPVAFTTFSSIFIPEIVQELIRRGLFVPPVPAIRYEELGINLRVRPRLHGSREVSLALKLEQKALTGQSFNAIPVIANRTLEQQVRLRTGETLLLAGLQREELEEVRTGTPLLSSVPVLGHLFRRTVPNRRTTELILLITPHLVRLPAAERAALRPLYLGTEKDVAPPALAPAFAPPTPPEAPPQPPTPQPPTPQPQPPPQPPPQD
ncbi:MAG: hypothetical protein HYY26_00355 [Acidobacteria bacterium]|nr:hypothetical protein [Acidobacteriota bacterium]